MEVRRLQSEGNGTNMSTDTLFDRTSRQAALLLLAICVPRQIFSIVIDDRTVGRFVTDDRGSVDMELQEGEVPPGSGS